jgi:dsRNA-specific ribonuclease
MAASSERTSVTSTEHPTERPTYPGYTTRSVEWSQALKKHLNFLLKNIIPDNIERNRYFSDEYMKIWEKAFTHESANPNANSNYEDIEYLGDAVLKCEFPKYLIATFPTLHKRDYTELTRVYQSKTEQAKYANFMKLGKYVLSVSGPSNSVLGDLYESFFGALSTISDKISRGYGSINCYNMIVYLYKNTEMKWVEKTGAIKTQVQQIFTRFALPIPEDTEEYDNVKSLYTRHIILSPRHLAFLKNYDVDLPQMKIGVGVGRTKEAAENNAYTAALAYLNSFGITTEWATTARQIADFYTPEISPYNDRLDDKLVKNGYTFKYFAAAANTRVKTGETIELIGVHADSTKDILAYINVVYMDYTDIVNPTEDQLRSIKRIARDQGRLALVKAYLGET